MLMAFVSFMLASCTKDNQTEVQIDPVEETEPTNVIDNPLVDNIVPRSDSEGCDLECFIIDYPFSISLDGEVSEIDSEEDLNSVFESITEESVVDFVYPLNITYDDGETAVINNVEELGEAFASCIPDEGWNINIDSTSENSFPAFLINSEESCYNLVYPLTLTDLVTGENVDVQNEEDFISAMTNTESILFFNFPLTLTGEEGEATANSGEELWDLLLACEYEGTGGGIDSTFNPSGEVLCYEIVYPFSVLLANGDEAVINNHEEYCAIMLEGQVADFVYPITLINAEGELTVVNSQEELEQAFLDCVFIFEGGSELFLLLAADNAFNNGYGCYDINYPISAIVDGEEVELNNFEDAMGLVNLSPEAQAVFPVNITLNTTGEIIQLESIIELFNLAEECE